MINLKRFLYIMLQVFLQLPILSVLAWSDNVQVIRDQAGYQTALKQYQPQAEQGDAQAQLNLALLYDSLQEYSQSINWFQKAANQGNTMAQFILAGKYLSGKGVKQDYVQAYKWISIAAMIEKTNQDFIQARDFVVKKMTPQQLQEGKGLVSEWKSK